MEKKPEIRFKEYDEEWKKYSFSNITTPIIEKNKSNKNYVR